MIKQSQADQGLEVEADRPPELDSTDAQFSDDMAAQQHKKTDRTGTSSSQNNQDRGDPNHVTRLLALEAAAMTSMSVSTSHAAVDIGAHDSAQILVTAESNEPFATEALEVKAREKSLSVIFKHRRLRGGIWKKFPTVKLKILVPKHFRVLVVSKKGEVTLTGISGNSDVRTSQGDIRLNQPSGPVRAESTSGNIEGSCPSGHVQIASRSGHLRIWDLTGNLSSRTKQGRASLEWKSVPLAAKVNIRADNRPVTVTLPANARINYRFITGASAIMNEFAQVNESNVLLRLISKRGDISVKKRRPLTGN